MPTINPKINTTISYIVTSTILDPLPVANPAKNRAAISMPAPLAKIVRSQLIMKGMERRSTVGRLPIFCASMPTGSALIAAPIARIEDTREPVNKLMELIFII